VDHKVVLVLGLLLFFLSLIYHKSFFSGLFLHCYLIWLLNEKRSLGNRLTVNLLGIAWVLLGRALETLIVSLSSWLLLDRDPVANILLLLLGYLRIRRKSGVLELRKIIIPLWRLELNLLIPSKVLKSLPDLLRLVLCAILPHSLGKKGSSLQLFRATSEEVVLFFPVILDSEVGSFFFT